MSEELKPCPFCGSAPRLLRLVEAYQDADGQHAGEYDAWFNVQCDNCGIEQGDEYRSSAIAAWNKRASRDAEVQRLQSPSYMRHQPISNCECADCIRFFQLAAIRGDAIQHDLLKLSQEVETLKKNLKDWEDNAKYLLDSTPGAIRSCYKGLDENLLESLCITYIKLRGQS
jgi:Lar family restriction alleviation protein